MTTTSYPVSPSVQMWRRLSTGGDSQGVQIQGEVAEWRKKVRSTEQNSGGVRWQKLDIVSSGYCRFCHKNGESAELYLSHVTKERSGLVQCPVLRSYKCPVCGDSGDKAHTISYCPRNRRVENNESNYPAIPTPMAGHLVNIEANNK